MLFNIGLVQECDYYEILLEVKLLRDRIFFTKVYTLM